MRTFVRVRSLVLSVAATGMFAASLQAADRTALGRTEKFRIFVDKVIAAPNKYVITEDHIRQIAEAGFNVVSPRRGHDDLARVRREAGWAQKHGMFFVPWMRGVDRADREPQMIWANGAKQPVWSPNADQLWDWMTRLIVGYAKISREAPSLIGAFLDYENYYKNRQGNGNLYGLSYDDKILADFAKAKNVTIPQLRPKQRKPWLVKQNLHEAFAEFQFAHWRARFRKLRKAVDEFNPKFQFFVCPCDSPSLIMTKALYGSLATKQAPLVLCSERTYGRLSSLMPQKIALAVNRKIARSFIAFMRGQRVPFMFLGGIDPCVRGADPEFSARNAVALSEIGNGYWVFYEGPTYGKPDHAAYMRWFARANRALKAGDYAFQHAKRETAAPFLGKHIGLKAKPWTTDPMPPDAAEKAFITRGEHSYVLLLKAGEEVRGRVEVRRVGRRAAACEVRVVGPDRAVLCQTRATLGRPATIRVKAKKAGLHGIGIASGKNAGVLYIQNQYCCLMGRRQHLIYEQPRIWFLVKAGAKKARLKLRTWSPGETARMAVYDPGGKEIVRGDTVAKSSFHVNAPVAVTHAGKAWSLTLTKASQGTLEDIILSLGQGCGRLLATHPSRLLVVE